MSTQRFEYLVHETKNSFFKMALDVNKLSEDLNRLGGQGWELVTQLSSAGKLPTSTSLVFKRAR